MNISLIAVAASAAMVLAACSSSPSQFASAPRAPVAQFATGPIFSACMQAGRKQASRAHCGCVQAVADQSLASSEQRRGARFFSDPHSAQEVRTSDRAVDERFWLRWKAFGDRAGQVCR